MRALEASVIDMCHSLGVMAHRDSCATGVWVGGDGVSLCGPGAGAKICAMGVRVRRWVTMHGLALNVAPDMSHFTLIVPCGLTGRAVTSIAERRVEGAPSMECCKSLIAASLALGLRPVRGQ